MPRDPEGKLECCDANDEISNCSPVEKEKGRSPWGKGKEDAVTLLFQEEIKGQFVSMEIFRLKISGEELVKKWRSKATVR